MARKQKIMDETASDAAEKDAASKVEAPPGTQTDAAAKGAPRDPEVFDFVNVQGRYGVFMGYADTSHDTAIVKTRDDRNEYLTVLVSEMTLAAPGGR